MKKRKRYFIFFFTFLFSILFSTSLFFYSKKNNTFKTKTKYINFRNVDIGLSGRIKTIEINNKIKDSNLHAFIMHAGGADSSDYIEIVKDLKLKSATIIDHNNLDPYENLFIIKLKRLINLIVKLYPFHDSFNNPELVEGSSLFWDMHEYYLKKSVENYFNTNTNSRGNNFIFIGHSHGSSLFAEDYIRNYTNNEVYIVYIAPCFNPKEKSKKLKSSVLIISGDKDQDGCATKTYNLDLIKSDYEFKSIKGMSHFSFLPSREPDMQHLYYYDYKSADKIKVVDAINKLINDNH